MRCLYIYSGGKCKWTGEEAIVAYCNVITSRQSSAVIEENHEHYRDVAYPD